MCVCLALCVHGGSGDRRGGSGHPGGSGPEDQTGEVPRQTSALSHS